MELFGPNYKNEAGLLQKSLEFLSADVNRAAPPIMELNKLHTSLLGEDQPENIRVKANEIGEQLDKICKALGFQFKNEDGVIKLVGRSGESLAEWDQSKSE